MFVLECISKASQPSPCPFVGNFTDNGYCSSTRFPKHFDKIGSRLIEDNLKILGNSMKLEVQSVTSSFVLARDLSLWRVCS